MAIHYVYRSANSVGLMRNGKILAEGSPETLLHRFNKNSLEDVFLHLCLQDDSFAGSSMVRMFLLWFHREVSELFAFGRIFSAFACF